MEYLIHVLNSFYLQRVNIRFLNNNRALLLQKVKNRRPVRWGVQRCRCPGEGSLLPPHSMTPQSEGSALLIPKSDKRHYAENFKSLYDSRKILINVSFSFSVRCSNWPLAQKFPETKVYIYIYICVCVCVCVCVHKQIHFVLWWRVSPPAKVR